MSRCDYCGGRMREEMYGNIQIYATMEIRVQPPKGVKDQDQTRKIIVNQESFNENEHFIICNKCGGIWEVSRPDWDNKEFRLSIDPAKYQDFVKRWREYEVLRGFFLKGLRLILQTQLRSKLIRLNRNFPKSHTILNKS